MKAAFSLLLILLAFSPDSSAKSHQLNPKPLFFQAWWKAIHNRLKPELICTINGKKVNSDEKRAELEELDRQKAALLKVIRKLNNDIERIKKITRTWSNRGHKRDETMQSLIALFFSFFCLILLWCCC